MGRAAPLAGLCLACIAIGGSHEAATRGGFPNVDVSLAAGSQAEVRVAADPTAPSHLLAASNSDSDPGMRVYESSDGGRVWGSEVLPRPPGSASAPCHSDPAPAFDAEGTEYVAFMQSAQACEEGGEHVTIRLAVRETGSQSWHYWTSSVFPEDTRGSFDDNPWLAADTGPASPYRGRLYLGWFRTVAGSRRGFELSHSDDRGQSWSEPRLVSDSAVDPGYPSLSVGVGGTLYAAWQDFGRGALFLDRSTDGGDTFRRDLRRAVRGRDAPGCPNGRPIPAQRLRCIRSDPTVIADTARNRVYLTYSDRARNGSEDVFVAAYDSSLRPRRAAQRLGAAERRPSDQFWPTAALEPVSGRVAVCFYSSGTGRRRAQARFSCAVSDARGRRWSRVRPVASVASDETKAGASEFAYGDYEGLAVAGGIAHPVWTDSRDLRVRGEEIYTASFSAATLSPGPRGQVDVSQARGPQNEPAIAVDPNDPSVLIASSNSAVAPMAVYTSTDGGASWSAQAVPADRPDGTCVGDPALAIDSRGRQYFAFLRDVPCGRSPPVATGLFVAARPGPSGPWHVAAEPVTGPLAPGESNDKPALATREGRVYAAWARAVGTDVHAIVVSHTDDGGSSWSAPIRVDAGSVDSGYPSIATGPAGEVYVAWHPFEDDRLLIAASFDGGETFGEPRLIDAKRNRSSCPASWPIPAQARRCVRPNPIVSVDRSGGPFRARVYVTYENQAGNRTQDVYVAAFDRSLTPLLGAPGGRRVVVGSRRRLRYRADQFWPASAVDHTSGTLWACFYDTAGDRSRRRAWFSCTKSTNGGAGWSPIRRVATVASNETGAWASPLQYGDYEGLAVSAGVAHPVWTDSRRGRSALREEIFTTAVG